MTEPSTLPKATVADTLRVLADVVIPTLAKGPIIRRQKMVAVAERLNLDDRAVRRMQLLHETYGSGPLLLRVPRWPRAVILAPDDVQRCWNALPSHSPLRQMKSAPRLPILNPRCPLSPTVPNGLFVARSMKRLWTRPTMSIGWLSTSYLSYRRRQASCWMRCARVAS